jgi:hypothetical protein
LIAAGTISQQNIVLDSEKGEKGERGGRDEGEGGGGFYVGRIFFFKDFHAQGISIIGGE